MQAGVASLPAPVDPVEIDGNPWSFGTYDPQRGIVNGESQAYRRQYRDKDVAAAKSFYQDILGLDLLTDNGWIATYGSDQRMRVQVGIASEGGSGTPVPDPSIEVDDLDAALQRMKKARIRIEYGPADEPWGVRRSMCATRSAGSSTF